VVPLFPLPRVWLFPYVVLPLRIFEPRYRQMVEDSLDGPGRIALGTVLDGHEDELEGSPPIHPLAGLGEIGRHERLANGLFNIWLVGLMRVRVDEEPSDRPYRQVRIEPALEVPVPREREEALRERLLAALTERTESPLNIPPQVPVSNLADLLIPRIPMPHRVVNELYSELDAEKRARLALEQHAKRRPEGD
jgi:Lon protease-like protein